jgi:hypothetical protein
MLLISRRTWLARIAGSSAALAAGVGYMREALAQGEIKTGVARASGVVRINGKPAAVGAQVNPGDVVETARGGDAVVVVNRDAYMIRANSTLEFGGGTSKVEQGTLRLLAGKVLSVFVPGNRVNVSTRTATIGIRGTGLYLECVPDCTYACTCYGSTQLDPLADPTKGETVKTTYHDSPRYIYASASMSKKGLLIEPAPVVNHTDAELILLESLVGRKVPFEGEKY